MAKEEERRGGEKELQSFFKECKLQRQGGRVQAEEGAEGRKSEERKEEISCCGMQKRKGITHFAPLLRGKLFPF